MTVEYLLDYLALTAIIWSRYFIVAGIFYVLLWKRPVEKVRARPLTATPPSKATMQHEITMSLLSSLIYAFAGLIVVQALKQGGTAIYHDVGGFWGAIYIPLSIFIYLFIHDTYFYFTHRWMHHPRLFHRMHYAHHRSRQPSPWAAFSFNISEAALSAIILPLAAFFIPIHIGAVFFLLIFMTYCSVANHAGWEILPVALTNGLLGKVFISASHHNVHHHNYKANFALYFRFWDQLLGTDHGLAAPVPAQDLQPSTSTIS